MQTNRYNFLKSHRSHESRLGSLVVAGAILFSLTGLGHERNRALEQYQGFVQLPRALAQNLERENETERHAVRLDVGLRLPSTTGI